LDLPEAPGRSFYFNSFMDCQDDYDALVAKSGGGQFAPEYPGQFGAEWVVSLNRNQVVNFSGISTSCG
jgi:hypothetical protein